MTNARLEELRAKFQENPRRYFAPFANELRKAGDPAQAIAVCRTHLAGQPGHVSGHIVLGQALYEAGEPNEARDVFTAALELDPENLIALRTLGEIAQVNGDFGGARQWYERLLEADPRNTEVAQLLKDIPTEAPPAPVASPPAAPVEEPTPFTVRADYEPPAPAPEPLPPAPVPTFHTSFTGSQRAYDPGADQKQPEPALEEPQAVDAKASDEPFIDLEPSAHDEQPVMEMGHEPIAAGESDPLAMVDFDELPQESVAASPVQLPDEAPVAASSAEDVTHEELSEPLVVAEEAEFSIEVDEAPAAAESTPADELAPPEPTTEHSRAVFAERGFDGPAEDEVGWMTTPSAAFSDLEAAPDAWFDESVRPESEEAPAAPTAEEPAVTEASAAADFTSDSWFDEVPGATAIESVDVTPSDLWLPPEIPEVTQAEDNTNRVTEESEEAPAFAELSEAQEPELVESTSSESPEFQPGSNEAESGESAVRAEAPEEMHVSDQAPEESVAPPVHEEEEPRWAVQSDAAEQPEPAWMDVEALNEEGEEAIVVERPEESPVAATWSGPERASPDEDHAESAVMEDNAESVAMESAPTAVPDLESVPTAEAFPVVEPSMEAAAEVPSAMDSVIGRTPAFTEDTPAPTPTPAPFITETLAELYLQQGFRDEALSIYRQLSERDPANESLKNRVAAIEERNVTAADAPEIRVESSAGSQSVRTFFARLARRQAVSGGQSNSPETGAEPDSHPDVAVSSPGSALANLFSASRPPASDEGAASTLAGAFSDPAGRPSRAAERELSLDHLFRDVPAGGSPGGGVTLDEFYSTPEAASGSPTEPGEAGGSEESGGADIRQFTAWLEGLRKK